jgi:hypothetical protein
VLAALGDKFLSAFAGSVTAARQDIRDMRAWRPSWFPTMHSRCLSNLIHDRIWAHLVHAVQDDDSTVLVEHGPTREVQVGVNLRLRIKRHRFADQISTYPTPTALAFYLQYALALPGLELVTLAAGYRWHTDLREIGAPVISYREGKDNPIWAVELAEPKTGAEPITWTPITSPELPTIEYDDAAEDDSTGTDDL